jgi:hypothetical protein
MDDDIKDIVCMVENTTIANTKSAARYNLSPLSGAEFRSWTESAFHALELSRTKLFGVYPVKNGYFMKDLPYVTEDLRFCVGTCWGVINDHRIHVTLEEKEDYERTLMCFSLYGSVLRYNHISPVTTYYRTAGGMQSRETDRPVESAR